MKKCLFIVYILILLIFQDVTAQQKFTNIQYDTTTIKEATCVAELNNHYYFLCNVLVSNHKTKAIIYKSDLTGVILDSITLTPVSDSVLWVQNIYAVGSKLKVFGASSNFNIGINMPTDFDFLQFDLDENLNLINSFVIPISDTNQLRGFSQAKLIDDKVFYFFFKKNAGPTKSLVLITDTSGNFLFSSPITEFGYYTDIIKRPNSSGYIVYTLESLGSSKIYILNDSLHVTSFTNSSIYSTEVYYALWNYSAASFIFAHIADGVGVGVEDSFAIRIIDTFGNTIKKVSLPTDLTFSSSLPFNNYTLDAKNKDNIYIGGNYNLDPSLSMNSYFQIANLDSNLNIRWCKNFGGDFPYRIYTYYATSDGGCLITGKRKISNAGNGVVEPIVFKISNTGAITSVVSFNKNIDEQIILYPNPAKEFITILATQYFHQSQCSIYSVSGTLLQTAIIHNGENIIDISSLAHGNYFYTIKNKEGKSTSGQFIRE